MKRLLVLVACAATVAACGGRTAGAAGTAASIARAQATGEYPSPRPPAESAAGGAPGAAEAIRRFATAYINWTADTVAADMQMLAADSVGQARSMLVLAATQTAGDYELHQGGIANSGAVEAIAPLGAAGDQYVVVTRESTTATNTNAYQGLRPAWHVALATVRRRADGGWVLSGWQPES